MKTIKRNIKLLAEKYNHLIEYDKNAIILKNSNNDIRIWEEDKHEMNVRYNIDNKNINNLKLDKNHFYDLLIELLTRKKSNLNIEPKDGTLLTLEEWVNEEGDFAKEKLENLKRELKNSKIEYRLLGGNRYVAEYFKGIIIITDDLYWAKSNVILV